jgi:hypothetical protein
MNMHPFDHLGPLASNSGSFRALVPCGIRLPTRGCRVIGRALRGGGPQLHLVLGAGYVPELNKRLTCTTTLTY